MGRKAGLDYSGSGQRVRCTIQYDAWIGCGRFRLTLGKEKADFDLVLGDSVATLMEKTTVEKHSGWAAAITADPVAHPARIGVSSRGATHIAARNYPKGSPSPDPSTYFTGEKLIGKFHHNAKGVLSAETADRVVELMMNLEGVAGSSQLTALLQAETSLVS